MATLWRRVGPWVTPVLVVVEIVLVATGVLGIGEAVIVIVVVEVALATAAITRGIAAVRSFRGSSSSGWAAAEDGLAEMLPRRAARVILIEARTWVCLGKWICRRRPGGTTFTYGAGLRTIMWIVLGLIVVEGVVLDGVLAAILGPASPWVWVALGLHVYGLVWIAGFLGALRVEPHRLTATTLELRDSIFGEVTLPLDAIVGVTRRRRENLGRSGFRVRDGVGLLAYGDANVRLELSPGTPLRAGHAVREDVHTLDLSVDDAAAFELAIQGALTARA